MLYIASSVCVARWSCSLAQGPRPDRVEFLPRLGREVELGGGEVEVLWYWQRFEALQLQHLVFLALDIAGVFDLGLKVFGGIGGKRLWRRGKFEKVLVA